MDGITNVVGQQQSQIPIHGTHGKPVEHMHKMDSQQESTKELQKGAKSHESKIDSEKDVKDLVTHLNKALEPLNTDVKFGVDSQDIFYVSVIDKKTDRMIRRFPAEQAQTLLPKMQEVSGVLFDTKG